MAARPCLYDDQALSDVRHRARPRSDGSPGREYVCERCGGAWAIGIGGRPVECSNVDGVPHLLLNWS